MESGSWYVSIERMPLKKWLGVAGEDAELIFMTSMLL